MRQFLSKNLKSKLNPQGMTITNLFYTSVLRLTIILIWFGIILPPIISMLDWQFRNYYLVFGISGLFFLSYLFILIIRYNCILFIDENGLIKLRYYFIHPFIKSLIPSNSDQTTCRLRN